MGTVLVADDEERVRTFLTRALRAEGHSVGAVSDGEQALEALSRAAADLVLLDLVMPRRDGLQVLTALSRERESPPVIVLSGVGDVAARVQALDAGAVDFVSKPFHVTELVARVRRHLPDRSAEPADTRFLHAGGVRLDVDRRHAQVRGRDVALTEREVALLAHLMRRRGDVCRRGELLHDVWGLEFDPGSNVVEVCVRRLRTKLADPPIETVRGVGYCFVGA